MTVWAQLQIAVSCGDPGDHSYDFIRSRTVLLLKHIRTYYLMTHGIPSWSWAYWSIMVPVLCLYPEVSLHPRSSPGYVYPYPEFCGLALSVKSTACRLGEVPATVWNVCLPSTALTTAPQHLARHFYWGAFDFWCRAYLNQVPWDQWLNVPSRVNES